MSPIVDAGSGHIDRDAGRQIDAPFESSGSGAGETGAKMSTPVGDARSLLHLRPRDEAMSVRSGNMIRLWTMPFRRLTAKAIDSARASGFGQVSGLRIHTPSQPRSRRKSRIQELTPPGKPRFSLARPTKTGDIGGCNPKPRMRRKTGASRSTSLRRPTRPVRARQSFDQRVERVRAPVLADEDPDPGHPRCSPTAVRHLTISSAFPNPTMTIGTSTSANIQDNSSVERKTGRCATTKR